MVQQLTNYVGCSFNLCLQSLVFHHQSLFTCEFCMPKGFKPLSNSHKHNIFICMHASIQQQQITLISLMYSNEFVIFFYICLTLAVNWLIKLLSFYVLSFLPFLFVFCDSKLNISKCRSVGQTKQAIRNDDKHFLTISDILQMTKIMFNCCHTRTRV